MFQNLPLSFFQDGTWNDNTCENPHPGFICKAPKTLKPVGTAQADLSQGCSVVSSQFSYYSYVKFFTICMLKIFF